MNMRIRRQISLSGLLWLLLAGPSPVLADRVYEGTGVETDGPGDIANVEVRVTVTGTAPDLMLIYQSKLPGNDFLRGNTFEITLTGTSYSGTNIQLAVDTIVGQIPCEGAISGVATGQGDPLYIRTFTAECVSGCEDTTSLPPECEDEEEDDDDPDCLATIELTNWIGSGGGDFEEAGRWLTSEVPGPQHVLFFNEKLVGGETIRFDQDVVNDSLDVGNDSVVLDLNNTIYSLSGASECFPSLEVGAVPESGFENGKLVIQNGVLSVNSVFISNSETSTQNGVIELKNATLNAAGDSRIGIFDEGVLRMSGTGTFFDGTGTTLGVHPGSRGELEVTNGAEAVVTTLHLGQAPGATGFVEVAGTDSFLDSLQEIVVGAAGIGSMAVVEKAGIKTRRLTLAAFEGSEGILEVIGANSNDVESTVEVVEFTVIGETGRGRLIIAEGGVVEGGLAAGSDLEASSIAARPGSHGLAEVVSDGTIWRTSVLNVGFGGVGELFIGSGGEVSSREAVLGNTIDGNGTVELANESLWLIEGRLIVALAGRGRIDVDETSDVFCDELFTFSNAILNGTNIFVGANNGGNSNRRQRSRGQEPHGVFTNRLVIEEGAEVNFKSLTLGAGGEVAGSGVVKGDLENNGLVAPGLDECSTAVLSMRGNYTQASAGTLRIKLGGREPGIDHDALAVSGHAKLAGTLRVDAIRGFRLFRGQDFEILTAGSIEGQFESIEGGGEFEASYEEGRVVLTVRSASREVSSLCLDGGSPDQCGVGLCGTGVMPLLPFTLFGMGLLKRNNVRRHSRTSSILS